MNLSNLNFLVRTPREIVLQRDVSSVRVPTETGQVGLRPRVEAMVLAVEPGLVVVSGQQDVSFVGTAGGLLRCDGSLLLILTPLAVCGNDEATVIDSLQQELARPNAEIEVRAVLDRLQTEMLRELRTRRSEHGNGKDRRP